MRKNSNERSDFDFLSLQDAMNISFVFIFDKALSTIHTPFATGNLIKPSELQETTGWSKPKSKCKKIFKFKSSLLFDHAKCHIYSLMIQLLQGTSFDYINFFRWNIDNHCCYLFGNYIFYYTLITLSIYKKTRKTLIRNDENNKLLMRFEHIPNLPRW